MKVNRKEIHTRLLNNKNQQNAAGIGTRKRIFSFFNGEMSLQQEDEDVQGQKSAVTVIGPSNAAEYLEEFCCSNPACQLSIKCSYGKLAFEKAGYKEECYYMRNPFEPPNIHKAHKDYSIDDFVVIGSKCFICEQQICVDDECSLFYKHTFCLKCVWRERHDFPDELVAQVAKGRKEREKKDNTK